MPSDYCTDEKKRRWFLGHDIDCGGDHERCKNLVRFGKQEYCGWCPPQVALHQTVREQAGCLWCVYYTKRLSYGKCEECLSEPKRINFAPNEFCPKEVKEKHGL